MKYENNKLLLAELCLIKLNSLLNNNKQVVKEEVNKQPIIISKITPTKVA